MNTEDTLFKLYVMKVRDDSKSFNERNDCLVVSLSIVTNMPYQDSHALCELAGRPKGKGWYLNKVIDVAHKLGIKLEKITLARKISAGTFAKENPSGKYYVTKKVTRSRS